MRCQWGRKSEGWETYLVFATSFDTVSCVPYASSIALLLDWGGWSMFRRLEITSVYLLHCCCCRCHATIHDFTHTLTYLVLGTRRGHRLLLVPLHLALQPVWLLHWWWWRWCLRRSGVGDGEECEEREEKRMVEPLSTTRARGQNGCPGK
jgi:hypothetical protein